VEPGEVFPIVREPAPGHALPVLVSIPHFGTDTLPELDASSFRQERYRTFPCGYVDPFAAEIYGALHDHGATVVATPYSRLFVDVNRARDDFEIRDGVARSERGVVRTHVRGDEPVFRAALRPAAVERRLARYYDPYHDVLAARLGMLTSRFGRAVLLDAHTASGAGLDGHEAALGTARGTACSAGTAREAGEVMRRHGIAVELDVPGYAGGHTVRLHGSPRGPVQALQVEFNAKRILRTSRRGYALARSRGERADHDEAWLTRCRASMVELVARLGARA
jgi:N-formylglutamate deformylase